jgi:glycosyltransferase involved in cell wall biosynthesis
MRLGINGRFLAAPATGVQRFALEVTRRMASRSGVTVYLPRGVDWPAALPTPLRVAHGSLPGQLWEQFELPRRARSDHMSVVLHPASAAPLVGGPHVVVLHDVLPLSRPEDFTLRYRVWTSMAHVRAARRAAAVVTVSDWSAQEIIRWCRIPRERVSVVEQAPGPLDAPASSAEVQAMRARHGLRERYVLAVVGADPRKGAAFLEGMWAGWPAAYTRPELVLVGRRAGSAHRAAPGRGTMAGVCRLGDVTDAELRALYTGAVALVHPSQAEGFGRPPLEALACGTRVLAAPYGPARAVLGTAADFLELDAERWRVAVTDLLQESSVIRADRIARGRAWAARFDWDRTVDRVWAVCESAVAESAVRALS